MSKPITLEKMKAYVDATWKKCQSEAWEDPVGHCTLEQLAWLQRVVPSTGTIALYTAPPKREWVGLTDEEINNVKHVYDWSAAWTLDDFTRVIEAKLKEKNT